MNITLAVVTRKGLRLEPVKQLVEMYLQRSSKYFRSRVEEFASEDALLDGIVRRSARVAPYFIVTDSRGEQVTSDDLAAAFDEAANTGLNEIIVAIGPADGWSPSAIKRASLTVSFGRVTLPHELAAVIAAEQIYRALTIRAGHPYHSGH